MGLHTEMITETGARAESLLALHPHSSSTVPRPAHRNYGLDSFDFTALKGLKPTSWRGLSLSYLLLWAAEMYLSVIYCLFWIYFLHGVDTGESAHFPILVFDEMLFVAYREYCNVKIIPWIYAELPYLGFLLSLCIRSAYIK